jgi:hypothetical protein
MRQSLDQSSFGAAAKPWSLQRQRHNTLYTVEAAFFYLPCSKHFSYRIF